MDGGCVLLFSADKPGRWWISSSNGEEEIQFARQATDNSGASDDDDIPEIGTHRLLHAPAQRDAGGVLSAMKKMNCFAGETVVQTVHGTKKMHQLEVGDYVLVPSAAGVLKYERVEMFYHREPATRAQFVVFFTESGKRLALTPLHLIPFGNCQQMNSSISSSEGVHPIVEASRFAQSAAVGDCLVSVSASGEMIADPIVKIGRQFSTGIYSPMTVEGSLITDGVLSSCFSQLESHSVQKVIFDFLMYANDFFNIGYGAKVDSQGIPSLINYAHDLSQFVLPFAKY